MINTKGLDKAEILKTLHNGSKAQGLSFLALEDHEMTIDEANGILAFDTRIILYFDYLLGKVMKVDLTNDDGFEERLYDRDNGEGAAKYRIDLIR
jgi:hypothetical protein